MASISDASSWSKFDIGPCAVCRYRAVPDCVGISHLDRPQHLKTDLNPNSAPVEQPMTSLAILSPKSLAAVLFRHMRSISISSKGCTGLICGLMVIAMHGPAAPGASLFGDHSCQTWGGLRIDEKHAWTNAFFAPLSLTFKGLYKSKEDKFNDDPKAKEAATRSIDGYCADHPDSGVSSAAGLHLKKLFDLPPD
ncbi:MAG: hypothetical protein RLZZ591_205 [Pseudomonadota bacterium]